LGEGQGEGTALKAAEMLKVSNPTARQIVALLQKAGTLKEISGRKWGQLNLAAPIIKVIERVAVP
jgi:DNA-binding IscR family transcriptional regulator